jgi:hypothetical protein
MRGGARIFIILGAVAAITWVRAQHIMLTDPDHPTRAAGDLGVLISGAVAIVACILLFLTQPRAPRQR